MSPPGATVDQPVLGDAGALVLDELVAPVAGVALGRHDLDDQLGGAVDMRLLEPIGVGGGDEEQVRLPAAGSGRQLHRHRGEEDPPSARARAYAWRSSYRNARRR